MSKHDEALELEMQLDMLIDAVAEAEDSSYKKERSQV